MAIENVFFEGPILWAQIDANMHLRHSAYADLGAQARLNLLEFCGITLGVITENAIGPILFREELIYHREVRAGDKIRVTVQLKSCKEDGSRWSFLQEIYRQDDNKAATINVEGAWIDLNKRKLTGLPIHILSDFLAKCPKTTDYTLQPILTNQ